MESKWVDSGLLELYSSCPFLPHSWERNPWQDAQLWSQLKVYLDILLLCLKTETSSVPRLTSNVLLLSQPSWC